MNERDEFRTPQYVFEWAQRRFGKFDIDLAATRENMLCEKCFTAECDALQMAWAAGRRRGWCNPPYSNIDPWIEKAIDEISYGFETIMLLPTPNGEKRDEILLMSARSITFVVGRIAFLRPDGKEAIGNTRGSCFVQFNCGALGKAEFDYVLRRDM